MTYSFFRNFSGARFWFGIGLAGILTQLEMSQKPFKVVGRTPGHTPLGISCWLEVIDFDAFLGFLLLALHVCYFSFASGRLFSCVSVRRARIGRLLLRGGFVCNLVRECLHTIRVNLRVRNCSYKVAFVSIRIARKSANLTSDPKAMCFKWQKSEGIFAFCAQCADASFVQGEDAAARQSRVCAVVVKPLRTLTLTRRPSNR